MSRYRSTDQHLEGSRPVPPPAAQGLSAPRVTADQGAPPRSRFSMPSWAKPLAAAVAGLVMIVGLLFILASQAYGVRPKAAFPCPPETSEAVQAATGCVMPAPDQDRWRGIP